MDKNVRFVISGNVRHRIFQVTHLSTNLLADKCRM